MDDFGLRVGEVLSVGSTDLGTEVERSAQDCVLAETCMRLVVLRGAEVSQLGFSLRIYKYIMRLDVSMR